MCVIETVLEPSAKYMHERDQTLNYKQTKQKLQKARGRRKTHGTKERKREEEERKKGRCRNIVKGQGGAGVPKWEDARSGPKNKQSNKDRGKKGKPKEKRQQLDFE